MSLLMAPLRHADGLRKCLLIGEDRNRPNVKTALLTHFGHGPRPLASQAGSAVAARFPRHIEVLQLAAAVFGATAVPFPQQLRRKVTQIVTSSRCSPVLSAKL